MRKRTSFDTTELPAEAAPHVELATVLVEHPKIHRQMRRQHVRPELELDDLALAHPRRPRRDDAGKRPQLGLALPISCHGEDSGLDVSGARFQRNCV